MVLGLTCTVAGMTSVETLKDGDYFEEELFADLDLQRADLSGKDFYRCTFQRVDLRETQWKRSRLEDCVFDECDLTHMRSGELRAHGMKLRGCKVMGVEWTPASLDPQLSFEDCNLRYSTFVKVHLRGAPFVRCNLADTSFLEVDLTDADFSESDLTGAIFEGATLLCANLMTARGAFIDPAKNKVKDVRLGVESAVLLAASFGMRVAGYHEEPKKSRKRK